MLGSGFPEDLLDRFDQQAVDLGNVGNGHSVSHPREKPRQFLRRSVRRRGWLLYRGVDRFLTNRDPRQEPLD